MVKNPPVDFEEVVSWHQVPGVDRPKTRGEISGRILQDVAPSTLSAMVHIPFELTLHTCGLTRGQATVAWPSGPEPMVYGDPTGIPPGRFKLEIPGSRARASCRLNKTQQSKLSNHNANSFGAPGVHF